MRPRGRRLEIVQVIEAPVSGIDALVVRVDSELLNTRSAAGRSAQQELDAVDCQCGAEHWGQHGAAGLLVVHRAPDGTDRVLMQRPPEGTHHAGTWSLPGGAREAGETGEQAAIRKAAEKAGLRLSDYTLAGHYVDDHGNWSFITVRADVRDQVTPAASPEGGELRWVHPDQVSLAWAETVREKTTKNLEECVWNREGREREPQLGIGQVQIAPDEALPLELGFADSWPAVHDALLDSSTFHAPHELLVELWPGSEFPQLP